MYAPTQINKIKKKVFDIPKCASFNFSFLLRVVLDLIVRDPYMFVNSKIRLPISIKKAVEILMKIVLNPYINRAL